MGTVLRSLNRKTTLSTVCLLKYVEFSTMHVVQHDRCIQVCVCVCQSERDRERILFMCAHPHVFTSYAAYTYTPLCVCVFVHLCSQSRSIGRVSNCRLRLLAYYSEKDGIENTHDNSFDVEAPTEPERSRTFTRARQPKPQTRKAEPAAHVSKNHTAQNKCLRGGILAEL